MVRNKPYQQHRWPTVELTTGEGTILVIEDKEPLVELFIDRLGYRVLQVRTGKEAVELAKTFDGQIDLALLDIKLPDMEGGRVYPLIMEARPDLKVIVCSGYSIHGLARVRPRMRKFVRVQGRR